MSELLHASLTFPTVFLTVAVGLSMVYWLFVILGALDIDLIGDADAGGHIDVGGHVDVGGHIDVGGHVDTGDVGGHVDTGDVGHAGAGSFLSALGLRRVPLTISMTAVFLIAWTTCLLGIYYAGTPAIPIRLGIMLLALLVALPVAGLLVRPLGPLFEVKEAKSRHDYVGHVCTVDTGRVDREFGQATIEDGGDVLRIPVRCDKEDNGLERHDKALVLEFDDTRDAYMVEPMTSLTEKIEQIEHSEKKGSEEGL